MKLGFLFGSLLPLISGAEYPGAVVGMFLPFGMAEPKSPIFTFPS